MTKVARYFYIHRKERYAKDIIYALCTGCICSARLFGDRDDLQGRHVVGFFPGLSCNSPGNMDRSEIQKEIVIVYTVRTLFC